MLGIAKKVTMLFVVAVAVRVEKVVGNNLPIREMVLIFTLRTKDFLLKTLRPLFLCRKS